MWAVWSELRTPAVAPPAHARRATSCPSRQRTGAAGTAPRGARRSALVVVEPPELAGARVPGHLRDDARSGTRVHRRRSTTPTSPRSMPASAAGPDGVAPRGPGIDQRDDLQRRGRHRSAAAAPRRPHRGRRRCPGAPMNRLDPSCPDPTGAMRMTVRFRWGAVTDVGRVREINQDAGPCRGRTVHRRRRHGWPPRRRGRVGRARSSR